MSFSTASGSDRQAIIDFAKLGRWTKPMSGYKPATLTGAQVVACPKCDARLTFCRSQNFQIDSCGFESYRLECKECRARLVGIVDPNDEELLLSEFEG